MVPYVHVYIYRILYRYYFCVYSRLLYRYFQQKFQSIKKANVIYHRLMEKLKMLDRTRELYVEILNEVGYQNLEQILVETFNIIQQ